MRCSTSSTATGHGSSIPAIRRCAIVAGRHGAYAAAVPGRIRRSGTICRWMRPCLPPFARRAEPSGAGPGPGLRARGQARHRRALRRSARRWPWRSVPKATSPISSACTSARSARLDRRRATPVPGDRRRALADALTSLLAFRSLRESERRLEAAQRIAHVGWWERDYPTGRVSLSDEARRIFGVRARRPAAMARAVAQPDPSGRSSQGCRGERGGLARRSAL